MMRSRETKMWNHEQYMGNPKVHIIGKQVIIICSDIFFIHASKRPLKEVSNYLRKNLEKQACSHFNDSVACNLNERQYGGDAPHVYMCLTRRWTGGGIDRI